MLKPIEMRFSALGAPECHPGDIPSMVDIQALGILSLAREIDSDGIVALTSRIIGSIYGRLRPGTLAETKAFLEKYDEEFKQQVFEQGNEFNPQQELPADSAVSMLYEQIEEYAINSKVSPNDQAKIRHSKLLASYTVLHAQDGVNSWQSLQDAG